MQHMESGKLIFAESKATTSLPHWYIIWLKNWNYSHWLITSTVSSVLLTEMGAVILTAYPGFLSNMWLSLGITSSLSISLLSVGIIGTLGLATGWLIYAGHLAYQSFNTLEFDYQPLIQLWSLNHETYGFILKKLIADDNFLKLTQYIQNYPGAKGLHEFLQNPENAASVRKILYLLDKIWSTDHISQKVKIVLLHLLSQHVQSKDAEDHLHNIFALFEILWENQHLNEDLIQQVFQNSSLLKPYLKELRLLANDQELLHQCIMEPSFIPFQIAANSLGEEDKIQSLYPYLKDVQDGDELPGPISSKTYQILQKYYASRPEIFIKTWQQLIDHPHLEVIDVIIQALSQDEAGIDFLSNQSKLSTLLQLFTNTSLSTDAILAKITDSTLLFYIILNLDAISAFNGPLFEKILLEKPLEICLRLIDIYRKKLYQEDKSVEMILADMDKLLINNQEMLTKILSLDSNSSRYISDHERIVVGCFQAQEPAVTAVSPSNEVTPQPKKRNPWHKVQKLLNLRSQTSKSESSTLESIPETLEEEEDAKKPVALAAYGRWSRSSASFFNAAEPKHPASLSIDELPSSNHL